MHKPLTWVKAWVKNPRYWVKNPRYWVKIGRIWVITQICWIFTHNLEIFTQISYIFTHAFTHPMCEPQNLRSENLTHSEGRRPSLLYGGV